MGKVTVNTVDVFTTVPDTGNPAGVVDDLQESSLNENQLQSIARAAGFSESVFIQKSTRADVKLRYFMPAKETPLCGHATIGAAYYLWLQDFFQSKLSIETKVGILKVTIKDGLITMEQDQPKFKEFNQSVAKLTQAVGITPGDLDETLPIRYGNTGSWTLLLPVKDKEVLERMKPDSSAFGEVLTEVPTSSIHPFYIESLESREFDGRHFASPDSGVIEDPVTGTAAGVMTAYFQDVLYPDDDPVVVTIHQGAQLDRPGTVYGHVERIDNHQKVQISGKAVLNPKSLEITI